MIDKTVVILLSDKRSGSTMFARELCRHPDIQTVAYSPHALLETHHWLKGAVVLGMAPQTFAGGEVYSGYGSAENARAYLVDCVKGNVPRFQAPADDRALVFKGWEALCQTYAQPVFFEKSPQLLAHWAALSLLLEWIHDTSFRVKVVGLTRNPLAVQYSAYRLFHTDPHKRQFGWLNLQRNLLAFQRMLPQETYLQVRYEDMVTNPQAAFGALCDFIGVDRCASMGASTHAGSLTKWKDDAYFTLRLDPAVKQMARRFGYSEDELHNPVKPAPPLSYRLKRKSQATLKLTLSRLKDRVLKPLLLRLGSITRQD